MLKVIIALVTLLSYLVSLFSAMIVFPYMWLPIGIIFALLGAYWLYRYKHKNRGVMSIALFTNGTFIALGQYLETVIPAISILVNILGVILTFCMMLVWYYWKEGQRHVEVRIKKEKVEEIVNEKTSFIEKIKYFIYLFRKQRYYVKKKGYPKLLAFQFAYIDYEEEFRKKEEQNSLDFILGKEVVLQRNEYDQSPDR